MDDIEKILLNTRHQKNIGVRLEAVRMLGQTGDVRAVEPLIQLLKDSWLDIREEAARALWEFRDARAIDALCSNLSDHSDGVAAAVALVKIGTPAVEKLISVLFGGNTAGRVASEVLGSIGDIRAIGPLIEALDLPDGRNVGNRGKEALVRIGNPAVKLLDTALRNGKVGCADILVRIGTMEAINALLHALEDENEVVRRVSAESLAKIGDKRAVDTLIDSLNSQNAHIRKSIVEALGKISDVRVIEPLIDALGDSDIEVQRTAEIVLNSFQTPIEAIALLISLSNNKKQKVRYFAASALCNAGIHAVDALIDALRDKDENVRKAVARALGSIGDKRAVEPLRAVVLGDQDIWVRRESENALKKLG